METAETKQSGTEYWSGALFTAFIALLVSAVIWAPLWLFVGNGQMMFVKSGDRVAVDFSTFFKQEEIVRLGGIRSPTPDADTLAVFSKYGCRANADGNLIVVKRIWTDVLVEYRQAENPSNIDCPNESLMILTGSEFLSMRRVVKTRKADRKEKLELRERFTHEQSKP